MAHFRFISDELSYSRALEQKSTILIPLRKLIWCTYIAIKAQVQTVKRLLGFPPHIKVLILLFFLVFQLCFADYFTPRQMGAPSKISAAKKTHSTYIAQCNSKLSYLGTDNNTVLDYSSKINLK